MDLTRLPGALHHYGGKVHALRRAGLGDPPLNSVQVWGTQVSRRASRRVVVNSRVVSGTQAYLARPGSCEVGRGVGGDWELLESSKPGRHRAEGTRWSTYAWTSPDCQVPCTIMEARSTPCAAQAWATPR